MDKENVISSEVVRLLARKSGAAVDHETGVIFSQCVNMYQFAERIAAWQREKDAEIVRNHSDSGFMFSDAILNQGGKE